MTDIAINVYFDDPVCVVCHSLLDEPDDSDPRIPWGCECPHCAAMANYQRAREHA